MTFKLGIRMGEDFEHGMVVSLCHKKKPLIMLFFPQVPFNLSIVKRKQMSPRLGF